MQSRGVVNLPLHGGKAPKWLFNRMVKLTEGVIDVMLYEYDSDEFLRRILILTGSKLFLVCWVLIGIHQELPQLRVAL